MAKFEEELQKTRDAKISRVINALLSCSEWSEIDKMVSRKRLAWYEHNKDKIILVGSDVRKSFELFFCFYADVNPDDVEIIYEDDKKIVWRSYNWCPYLEACKQLKIDTRSFCREGHEKCMDDLVKVVNPNLKFSRSYERIRPHYDFCEETIELIE